MGRKICKFTYHFLRGLFKAIFVIFFAIPALAILTLPATISYERGVSLKNSIIINVVIFVGIAAIAGLIKLYELGKKYVLEDKYEKWEHGETSGGRLEED